jgi:polyglutamine-binding protein 1
MQGKWSAGMGEDGKMADSTAGGPLWQQRPYPAPGEAMKNKPKAAGATVSGPELGPAQRPL